MSEAREPRVIADAGRLVVAEDGPRVLVIDRGRGPSEITAFLLVIVTLVCGAFGVVSMVMAVSGALTASSVVIGAVVLTVGVVAGIGMSAAARSLRRARLTPLSELVPVAVFDGRRRVYLGAHGEIVAPLDRVRVERRARFGSLSPDLVVATPDGPRVLLRGNVFSGSIGNVDDVLNGALARLI